MTFYLQTPTTILKHNHENNRETRLTRLASFFPVKAVLCVGYHLLNVIQVIKPHHRPLAQVAAQRP